jgi:hypothetical protein
MRSGESRIILNLTIVYSTNNGVIASISIYVILLKTIILQKYYSSLQLYLKEMQIIIVYSAGKI